MEDWLWYLFGSFVLHAKKSVLIFALPFIYIQFLCTESLEPDSCLHAKLLSSPGPVPLTSGMTLPALLYLPWFSFPTSTLNRKKHLLHIALLNGTDRMVLDLMNGYCLRQAEGGKDLHLLYCPLNFYSHFFCNCWLYQSHEAVENSRRQLSSQGFDQKKRLQLRTDSLLVRARQGQTSSFLALHWTIAYLNTWLASLLLRDRYLWAPSRLKHYLVL